MDFKVYQNGPDDDLHILYCSAHFLLALSSCAELQVEWGLDKIGGDAVPRPATFSRTESAAVQYDCMACEELTRCGDEKNGCRELWEQYCEVVERPSTVSSNRANSLFMGAASLCLRRHDIWFLSCHPGRNQKLTSVLLDAQSDGVQVFVAALGLKYYRATAPHWRGPPVQHLLCRLPEPKAVSSMTPRVTGCRSLLLPWA